MAWKITIHHQDQDNKATGQKQQKPATRTPGSTPGASAPGATGAGSKNIKAPSSGNTPKKAAFPAQKTPTSKSGGSANKTSASTQKNSPGKASSGKSLASQPKLPASGPIASPLLGSKTPVGAPPQASIDQATRNGQAIQKPPVGSLLPKSPPKEPKPTPETAQMRKRQTQVLKNRQQRELRDPANGAPRDVDAGVGTFPPLQPLL